MHSKSSPYNGRQRNVSSNLVPLNASSIENPGADATETNSTEAMRINLYKKQHTQNGNKDLTSPSVQTIDESETPKFTASTIVTCRCRCKKVDKPVQGRSCNKKQELLRCDLAARPCAKWQLLED
jgi:hypothetical protein